MSDVVFPTLKGLGWSRSKKPIMSTGIQTSTSGMERRCMYYTYPRWEFTLTYEVLTDITGLSDDLQTLVGFWLQRYGAFDSFLYQDPNDYTVTQQPIANLDGVSTEYQLVRTWGGFTEPVKGVVSVPTLYVNYDPYASVPTDPLDSVTFSCSTSGLITFTSAPVGSLTANFNYYYRCRFKEDTANFEEFAYKLWSLQSLEFISLK